MTDYEKAVLRWHTLNIRDDADLETELNGQIALYAYHSGKIENEHVTYDDTREIFEHDRISSYTGDIRTIFELVNAKRAMEFFLESFAKRRPVDIPFLLEMQKILTENTYDERRIKKGERPGEFKHHDYVVGKNETGAAAEDVEAELSELLADVNSTLSAGMTDSQVLTAAAFFHAKFENIHPFSDGNGRTGRLVMNYYLVMNNHPMVIIHEEDRRTYFAALDTWHEKQDLFPLKEFLEAQVVKTWKRSLERQENLEKLERKKSLKEDHDSLGW